MFDGPDESFGVGVFFGGTDGTTAYNDTWAWDGTAWNALAPANPPPGRAGFAVAYDSWRDEMVIFGGAIPNGAGGYTYKAETWVLGY